MPRPLSIYVCPRYFEDPSMCEYATGADAAADYPDGGGPFCRFCTGPQQMVRVEFTPPDPTHGGEG